MTDTITLKREVVQDALLALESKWTCYETGSIDKSMQALKAALAAPQPTISSDQDVIENLMTALKWYADGEHFTKADPDAWDTVSDEPQNWWCDEAGTAMVEDGSLAKMVLSGEVTGAQLHAMEDGEVFEPQPVKQADQSCRNCTFNYKDVDMPPCNSCTLGDHVGNNWEPMSAGQKMLARDAGRLAASDVISYTKNIYDFLQSTSPDGFAQEAFRLPPFATGAQRAIFDAASGDAQGKHGIPARQDSCDRSKNCGTLTQPVKQALKWTPVVEWWESGNEDFDKLKDAILAMLAAREAK